MKKIVTALVFVSSISAFAWETRNDTSYSGPYGGTVSGSTQLSGTSAVRAREQVQANAEQIAVLNQVYSAQVSDVIKNSRVAAIENFGADKVAAMTDQEILSALMQQQK